MSARVWARLDNASNIFLAARTDADPKVFRLSAEMDREVDPEVLQRALDATVAAFPLYRSVLRRGVFWYYLQESDLQARAAPDLLSVCAPIYREDHRTLLFRVVHHRRRISLEVFHALSDGTGALAVLTELVTAYVRLRRETPPATADAGDPETPSADGPPSEAPAPDAPAPAPATDTAALRSRSLAPDGFRLHFPRRRPAAEPPADAAEFLRAARPAVLGSRVLAEAEAEPEPGTPPARTGLRAAGREHRHRAFSVHRVRGTRTPDGRTRAVEITVPAAEIIGRAKAAQAGTSMYLTALWFEAVRRSAPDPARARTLAASVPVNLRQYYPSDSPRNFFTALRVEHTYGPGGETVAEVARHLEAAFQPQLAPATLDARVRRLIDLERMPLLRIVPRPLKDVLLGLVNRVNNRGLTVAVSNLGRVRLPEDVDGEVRRLGFMVSAARPQICAISHDGQLVITVTSPFAETGPARELARLLTAEGMPVRVAANRVREHELLEEDRV